MAKLQPLSTNLTYPLDLMDMSYGGNAMIFHVNFVIDSKYKKANVSQRVSGLGPALAANALSDPGKFFGDFSSATNALQNAGNSIIENAKGFMNNVDQNGISSALGGVKKSAINTANAGANAVSSSMKTALSAAKASNRSQKLNTSIMLYMPQEGLHTQYNINYKDESLGITGALANSLANGGSISGFIQSMGNAAPRAIAGATAAGIDALTAGNAMNANSLGTLEAMTRTTLNPRKEQLFAGVDYRTFNYTHIFTPTTAKECQVVRQIIQTFKLHMHPTLSHDGFYYDYPSEFEIEYHFGGEKNKYLDGITSCALTNLQLSYGNGSSWQTLVNGHPTHITMRTTFMELEALTREKIKDWEL